jgi:hypothetical protein
MPTSQARFACRARTIFLPATANGASRPKATEERNVHYQLVDLSNNAVPTSQIALVNFIQLAVVYWERSSKSPSGAAKSFQAE